MSRLRRRLEETGSVALKALANSRDIAFWCQEFFRLENTGWKGREGSAMAASRDGARFFVEAIAGAFKAGALRFYRLDVGERTIAMIVNFINCGEGVSFKIAHDPEYARYSPGVMLEIEMLKALEGEVDLRFVDSCASPDHSMINSLWTDRRTIVGLNVSGPRWRDRTIFAACSALESARARFARTGAQ